MEYFCHYESPLGGITLACDGDCLTGLWFDGQKNFPPSFKSGQKAVDTPVFSETVRWLDIYFSGREPYFTPPLCLNGSDFRKMAWEILLSIPYGTTVTYADIAKIVAKKRGMKKMSPQAVGGAVGHNNISLIIPCHRAVGSDGSLTGYAGGLARKAKLLELEGNDMSQFYIPQGTPQ